MKSKTFLTVILSSAIALAMALPVSSQAAYPEKEITIIMPWASGGLANVIFHTLSPSLEKELGVPVVILEKPGGGGAVGWSELQISKPDGYTYAASSNSLFGATYQTKGRVDFKNFEPVCSLTSDYFGITVNSNSSWKTFQDYLQYAKKNPGKMRAGSSGSGGIWHICILAFEKAAGVDITHIPFKGGAKSVVAVVGGHIESTFATPGDMTATLPTGKLRILAIGGPERDRFYPDVPTVKESGVDLVMGNWRGLIAPKGTPMERMKVVEKAFEKAVQNPKYVKFCEDNRINNDFKGMEAFNKEFNKNAETIMNILNALKK